MQLKYLLLEPVSHVYHIFAQFDYSYRWGPASIYSLDYVKYLKQNFPELLLEEKLKLEIQKNFEDYFLFLTFFSIRPWYSDYSSLINDYKDEEVIKTRIKNYSYLSFEKTKKALLDFTKILKEDRQNYSLFWEKNSENFNKRLIYFQKEHEETFLNYYEHLKQNINKEVKAKDVYFVFLVPSLFPFGRGLEGGCVVGLPKNKQEILSIKRTSLHELTHSFTDPLLAKQGFNINCSPNDYQNHNLKERAVENVLEKYIKENIKFF